VCVAFVRPAGRRSLQRTAFLSDRFVYVLLLDPLCLHTECFSMPHVKWSCAGGVIYSV
jgi:hypothetical protein